MKSCKHCNETKVVSEFFLIAKNEYASMCKECFKKEIQNHNKKRKVAPKHKEINNMTVIKELQFLCDNFDIQFKKGNYRLILDADKDFTGENINKLIEKAINYLKANKGRRAK